MENKYYTPTIEEFHVGFEFEELEFPEDMLSIIQVEDNWKDRVWKPRIYSEMFLSLQIRLDQKELRVKLLDKEDIESLGFPLNCIYNNKLGFVNCKDFKTIADSDNNIIEEKALQLYSIILEDNQKVTIRGWLHYDVIYFQGTIKNKSELKQVLKMIRHNG